MAALSVLIEIAKQRIQELEAENKRLQAEVAKQEETIRMLLLDKANTHLDMARLLNQL